MLVIIADDLAGACDTAAEFCGRGPATVLVPSSPPAPSGGDVLAIDTESRSVGRDDAARRVRAAGARLGRLLADGALLKKIDSTLRGSVGVEIDALLDVAGRPAALVCPAFPRQGRTVRGGVLEVAGAPVHATAIGRDPDYPAATSDIVAILAAQTARPLARLPLERVRRGAEAVAAALSERLDGGGIVVADAETDADLATLACGAVARPGLILAGSAGLAGALAAELGLAGPPPRLPRGTSWLVLAGSLHPASRAQVAALAAAGGLLCRVEATGDADVRPIVEALQAGRPAVITGPDSAVGSRERMAARLAAAAARVLDGITPSVTCVTGGNTAHALIAALGATRLEICGAPRSGLALGDLVSPGRRVRILTKAGGFGPPDLLVSLQEDTRP